MGVLTESDRDRVRSRLDGLEKSVTLVHFNQRGITPSCRPTTRLLEELSGLSERVRLRVFDFEADRPTAARYGVDQVPATVITGERGLGIRYFGYPGVELEKFLDGITIVSSEGTRPAPDVRERLAVLTSAPNLQAFITAG